MSIKSFVAVLLAFAAATAFAQDKERLGTVDDVQGLVTVTDGATGRTVATGNPIISGMRFVTTSSGSAVLRFDNGCVIDLKPRQAVTVTRRETCEALLAAVQPIGGANAAGGGLFANSPVATGALVTGALVAGGLALRNGLTNNSLSSN